MLNIDTSQKHYYTNYNVLQNLVFSKITKLLVSIILSYWRKATESNVLPLQLSDDVRIV